jgi:hypothetical protein
MYVKYGLALRNLSVVNVREQGAEGNLRSNKRLEEENNGELRCFLSIFRIK